MGVKNYDLVEIQLESRKVRGPVWVQPGFADYSLGLALGYGREQTGRVGVGTGFNAYRLRTSEAPNFAVGQQCGRSANPIRSPAFNIIGPWKGRPIIREANLAQYPASIRILRRRCRSKKRRW